MLGDSLAALASVPFEAILTLVVVPKEANVGFGDGRAVNAAGIMVAIGVAIDCCGVSVLLMGQKRHSQQVGSG